ALGKIGGPKVIDAVLELVRDRDEDIRRAAVEILNQTKDERAINHLIEATKDADWWVSERAVPVVVRAIGKLGDSKSVGLLLPLLARNEKEIRVEVIQALARLSDEQQADQIRVQLQGQSGNADATVARAAVPALTELEVRFSAGVGAL